MLKTWKLILACSSIWRSQRTTKQGQPLFICGSPSTENARKQLLTGIANPTDGTHRRAAPMGLKQKSDCLIDYWNDYIPHFHTTKVSRWFPACLEKCDKIKLTRVGPAAAFKLVRKVRMVIIAAIQSHGQQRLIWFSMLYHICRILKTDKIYKIFGCCADMRFKNSFQLPGCGTMYSGQLVHFYLSPALPYCLDYLRYKMIRFTSSARKVSIEIIHLICYYFLQIE